MKKTVYTLKKEKNTDELHLFRATLNNDNTCTPERTSICKGMELSDSEKNEFTCSSEVNARLQCAKIGRQVCGTCVSHLYSTYN
jgi:hypothetical protein